MSTTRCSMAWRDDSDVAGRRSRACALRLARGLAPTALAGVTLVLGTCTAVAGGPKVAVHDAAELQAAVADPANAGKTIALVPWEYKLDPSGPGFGRQVDDFRVVDSEALAMLNVSATQEVVRRMDDHDRSQQPQVDRLAERLRRLEAAIAEAAGR